MNVQEKSQLGKGILKITLNGKFERLIGISKSNGNGWEVKTRNKTRLIKYVSIDALAEDYQIKHPDKKDAC